MLVVRCKMEGCAADASRFQADTEMSPLVENERKLFNTSQSKTV
jgi:hypothetical protein